MRMTRVAAILFWAVLLTIVACAPPAHFVLGELTVTPTAVNTGGVVTISTAVSNIGGTEGTYAVVFKLNGAGETTKDVTLKAGETKTVTFTVTKNRARMYAVDVNGKIGQFTVTAPVTVTPTPPTGHPTALWRDGTYSYSRHIVAARALGMEALHSGCNERHGLWR